MKYWKEILIILLLGGLVLSLFDGCGKGKELVEIRKELRVADSMKNELGQTVYRQNVQIVQKDTELKAYTDSIFNLKKKHEKEVKKVHAFYATRTKVEIDSVLVPYKDTSWTKKWKDSIRANCAAVIQYYEDSTVRVGTVAKDSTPYYNIELTVQKAGVLVNTIQFVDSQYIRVVTIKGGLFKRDITGKRMFHVKRRMEVQVLHTNPYFKNIGINSIVVVPPKDGAFVKGLLTGAALTIGTQILLQ